MNILKKVSIATVNPGHKGGFKGITEKTFVARIVGSATDMKVGTTQFGDFVEFKGNFKAWGQDGLENVSNKCFLPSPIDSLLANTLGEHEGQPVEFAFDIFAVPHDSEIGYSYICQTLAESKAADPLAALTSALPQLALPSKPSEGKKSPVADNESDKPDTESKKK